MSFTHVPHAVFARDLLDADAVHTFSKSSRNTLITTTAIGKSIQSCSFASVMWYESVADMDVMFGKLADHSTVCA